MVALRLVYAGLLLTRTPGALWGGALLRLARHLARGRPPATLTRLAGEYADPCCPLPPAEAASLAVKYLEHGDLAPLRELQPLRDGQARWLAVLRTLGRRAALATPLEGKTFGLIAVFCERCAGRARSNAIARLVVHVGTYDAAIRCPKCGQVPLHPLPRVDIGEPHPVARCVAGATGECLAHMGDELDADGLCHVGRAIYDQAVAEFPGRQRPPTPRHRALLEALLRAQHRRPVLPDELRPVFAALAKADPEAARALEQITGAPIDTAAADPELVDMLTPRPGLSTVLTAVEDAVEQALQTFLDELADDAQAAPRGRGTRTKANRAGGR
jgi:hypothetical protein